MKKISKKEMKLKNEQNKIARLNFKAGYAKAQQENIERRKAYLAGEWEVDFHKLWLYWSLTDCRTKGNKRREEIFKTFIKGLL